MKVPITGNVRIVFEVDSVEVEAPKLDLDDSVTDFPVAFSLVASNKAGTAHVRYHDEVIVTKAQIEADAGKPFAQCTTSNIRRAIQRTVVAHVKATL